jgi:hypothetical protein
MTPVVVTHEPSMSADDQVRDTDLRLREAIERPVVPIPDLVRALGMTGGRARSVISVTFSLHVDPLDDLSVGGSPATAEVGVFNGAAKFDLDVIVVMSGRGSSRAIELIMTADGSRLGPTDIEMLWEMMVDRLHIIDMQPR